MTIAVNTRFLLPGQLEGYGYFTHEIFRRITKNHPEHHFIFLFDRPFDPPFIYAPNITPVVISPAARHPLLWKWWYDFRVPAILKKYKADLFVSPDGYCSLTARVPQCMVVHDLSFLHFPCFNKTSHVRYYRSRLPRFLQKAKRIVTVSAFSKRDILSQYHTPEEKIEVIHNAARDIFQPLDNTGKERVKQAYTDGKEYFIYAGAIHPRKNLVNLLKAFSIFKKRQQSQMKLVIAGRLAWKFDRFISDLQRYRYRDDVVLTGYLENEKLAEVVGASYAMVYPSLFEGFGMPVLEAMQAGVPVITSSNSAMEEIGGEAALYADPANHESIADAMMRIYKDEELRRGLIHKGTIRSSGFSWDKTANAFWDCMMRTAQPPGR
jgi:glycosyltransferase involved in cell wall biosynthesis